MRSGAVTLVTRRFRLRDFVPADLAALAAYRDEVRFEAMRRQVGDDTMPPAALLALFLAWQEEEPRIRYQWAVEALDDARLVGTAGLRGEGSGSAEAEFGLELAPDQWGRHGAALEIATAVVGYGFETLGLAAIQGEAAAANDRVSRLAEFAGAARVAVRGDDERRTGRIVWRLTQRNWAALRERRAGRR